jgi:hypothetical protein
MAVTGILKFPSIKTIYTHGVVDDGRQLKPFFLALLTSLL